MSIVFNKRLTEDFFLMKAEQRNRSEAGQFYMLRAWNKYPVLSRPISVFDADDDSVTFLLKVVGEGTAIFSLLKPGDSITLNGPYGNTFPQVKGKIALVGGGAGIAPLYLAAKRLKALDAETQANVYLGFSDSAMLQEEYGCVADSVHVNVGGFVTDDVEPGDYDHIFACGPSIMMKVLYEKCRKQGAAERLLISMENRMACGVGACLVCSCKTSDGNRKVCKDGPVFPGKAVFEL